MASPGGFPVSKCPCFEIGPSHIGGEKAHPAVPGWSICSMRVPYAGDLRRARRGTGWPRARSLKEFQTSFPDETSCAAFLFERRWPQGFVCPACGGGRAALLKSRAHTYECLDCGRQTLITAGTAMHRSKLPLTVWFWAAHLMATHSNGMSAVQFEFSARHHVQDRLVAGTEAPTIDARSPA